MMTLFISLLYIFQAFVLFNGNNSLPRPDEEKPIRVIKSSDSTIIGTLSTSNIYAITDEEINEFYERNYEGNIYSVYNYGFVMSSNSIGIGKLSRFASNLDYNYLRETTGTICCDEEFLLNLYGNDGKLNVLCGTLDDADKKLIITDYTAQCLINYSPYSLKTYEDVFKKYQKKLCAIIDTDYEERYKNVLIHEKEAVEKGLSSNDYINLYAENDEHIKFLKEVQDYLGLCYTFASSENMLLDVVKINSSSCSYSYFYVESENSNKVLYEDILYNLYFNGLNSIKLNTYYMKGD